MCPFVPHWFPELRLGIRVGTCLKSLPEHRDTETQRRIKTKGSHSTAEKKIK